MAKVVYQQIQVNLILDVSNCGCYGLPNKCRLKYQVGVRMYQQQSQILNHHYKIGFKMIMQQRPQTLKHIL